ncbi:MULTISPECIES: type II secretion system minor pseudopilin GspK [Sphingomonas]|nr:MULTISPECIES: type II secretion system minor pseudopilin GspK [Sphingomonas]
MRRRNGERGAALLTVLLLVAVIAVMAATALEKVRLATRLAANAVAMDQARGYAYAAEALATMRTTALLRRAGDRVALTGGWSGRPFGLPIPGGTATARITDGGNCFNLNSLVTRAIDGRWVADGATVAQFARLMRLLRVPGGETIAPATADWIDSDDVPLPGGTEDPGYRGYRTAGTLMADVSEWRAVAGVTPQVYRAVRPYLCALPVAERATININTLLPEQGALLAMLLPDTLSPQQAGAVLSRRPPDGWAGVDPLWNQLSLSGGGGATPDLSAKQQTAVTTRWFALAVDVANGASELHEQALIDARALPVRLVARQWGDAT